MIYNNNMFDYSKGKIYKLICNITGNIYIDSTIQSLEDRLIKHKKLLNKNPNNICSIEILKNNNYQIILIEDYPCETKKDLLIRERYYIDITDCINKRKPFVTNEEKLENLREWNKKTEYSKKKYIKNKNYYVEYREKNKIKNSEYQKQYRKENIEKYKNRDKEKYQKKKGKIISNDNIDGLPEI